MNRLQTYFRNDHFVSSIFTVSIRQMSKYLSKSATKRLPLSTKRVRKGYYKGKGGTKEGHITSKAKFVVDPKKRLQLIVPDLEGFKVRRTKAWIFLSTFCNENLILFYLFFVDYFVAAETICSSRRVEASARGKTRDRTTLDDLVFFFCRHLSASTL